MQYFSTTRHQLSEAITRKNTKKAMHLLRDLFDTMAEVMHAKDMSNHTLQCYYNQVTQRLVDAERYWQRVEFDTDARHSAQRDESFAKIEALREEVSKLSVLLKQQQQQAEADQDSFITTITKGMAKQAVTAAMLEGSKRQVAELSAKVEDMEAREAACEEAAAAREKALAIQVATLMAENDKLRAAAKTAVTEGDKGLKACGGDGKDDINITTTKQEVKEEEEAAPPVISTAKPSPAAAAAAAAEAPSTPMLGESCGAAGGASKAPSAAAVKAAQAASLAVSGLIRRPSSGGSSGRSSPSAAPSHTYGTNNAFDNTTNTKTTTNSNSNQSNKGGRRRNSSGKSKNHGGRSNHNHSYGSGFSQGMGAGYQGGRRSSGGGSYGSFNSNTSSGGGGGCYRGYEGGTARGSHSYTEGYTTNNNNNRSHSHPHSTYGPTNKAQRGGYGHNTTGRRSGPSGGAYSPPYSSY